MRIEIRELTMEEVVLIKEATGRSLIGELATGDAAAIFDEQMTSALVWIVRRRSTPRLAFKTVYSTLTLDEFSAVEVDLGSPKED